MANLQDIRRRIRSVKSIQQITNAMDMVATSRLRRAKEAANRNRPYAEKTAAVIRSVAAAATDVSHPLLEQHAEGRRLILVMAADKGLAGAYSSNALKTAMTLVEDRADTQIIAVGRKARDFFKNRGFDIVSERVGISERPQARHAQKLAATVISAFEASGVKEVYMVYTRFVSAITCVPEIVKLLPFETPEHDGHLSAQYSYEPNAEDVLGALLPQYLFTTIYAALLQSAASELSSRMNAMSNATDNAGELIGKLDLYYNKVRQAGITNEINEIVGGAEALK